MTDRTHPQGLDTRSLASRLIPTLQAGLREIWAHKFRSLLTMLGIVLGVSSLVAMSALVTGMERGAREALIAIGGLARVRVEPAELPVDQRHLADQAVGITLNDVEALERSAPLVRLLSPEMRIPATVSANGKTFRPWMCVGVRPAALEMMEHRIAHGRMFNELDDELARNVCVIGTATRDELWGSPEETGREIIPVGETLYINGVPFVIIGMFEHYESEQERRERELRRQQQAESQVQVGPQRDRGRVRRPGGFAFRLKNSTILIPLNTVWMRFRTMVVTSGFGPRWFRDPSALNTRPDPVLSGLEVKVVSVDLLPEALQQMRNVLMLTHRGIEDFQFRTQEEWAEQIDTFVRNARLSGGLIAGISLLVGGIGIMNIMLASISERVREIGIRKSVGASDGDIFVQILVESVVVSVLGGLLGMVAAVGLVHLVAQLSPTGNEPVITPLALGVAFGFSVVVGILAGIYPAVKAARLHPIEALRYE
jgi:putative ABC transport system permease protein